MQIDGLFNYVNKNVFNRFTTIIGGQKKALG
jgi:hypothetical protein